MGNRPFERPELGVINFDVVFAEEFDGVLLGKSDGAVLQRREDRRRNVDVVRQHRRIGEETIRRPRERSAAIALGVPTVSGESALLHLAAL